MKSRFIRDGDPMKSCFARLEAKQNPSNPASVCATTADTARVLAQMKAVVRDVVGSLEAVCGNGVVEGDEICDGADLGGRDCTVFGLTRAFGLACTPECTLTGCATDDDGPVVTGFRANGDGTVPDRTGLTWEVKTGAVITAPVYCPDLATCPDPHDVNNRYTWDHPPPRPPVFAGSAKTAFLDVLNDVAGGGVNCFAGHCDWRLPSLPELMGLLLEPKSLSTCSASPCIDPSFPGPTAAANYWSGTADILVLYSAWWVSFHNGAVDRDSTDGAYHVRAVRGGL